MSLSTLQQQAAACLTQRQYVEAVQLYQACIAAAPDDLSHYWQLGLAWLLQGDVLEAQGVWLSVLEQGTAEQVEPWTTALLIVLTQTAEQCVQQGQVGAAELLYRQILELEPADKPTHERLSYLLYQQGRLEEAIAHQQQAIALDSQDSNAYSNLALLCDAHGNSMAAIAAYQHALSLNPRSVTVHYNVGELLGRQGDRAGAEACYRQAIALDPACVPAYANLAELLNRQGQTLAAIACCRQILALDPHSAQAHRQLGIALSYQGDLAAAQTCYEQALAIAPTDAETHFSLAELLLQQGQLRAGWAEFEWRRHFPELAPQNFSQPLWDGAAFAGRTLLIHAEYGFGDTLQFIRYAPLAAQPGGRVVVQCPPALVRLLRSLPQIAQVISQRDRLPAFDLHVPLLSLPHIFGTTLDTIPNQVPYLTGFPHDGASQRPLPPALSPSSLKVGIAWAGNPNYPADFSRSCTLADFLPLLHLSGITFYSLQKGDKRAELRQLLDPHRVIDLDQRLQDFADTAAIMEQLDLIITTDTAVAHLAGALNRPVWVLLAHAPDWRWLLHRCDSPWYPSMTLFRQSYAGDWAGVMAQVGAALSAIAS